MAIIIYPYHSQCVFHLSGSTLAPKTSRRKLISLTKTKHKQFLRKNHVVWLNARQEGRCTQGNKVQWQSLFTHTILNAFLTFREHSITQTSRQKLISLTKTKHK